MMLQREKLELLTSKVGETSENSGSADWERIYERRRRKSFQQICLTPFSYLASLGVDKLFGQFV